MADDDETLVLVCVTDDQPSHFPDDVHGACARCGASIHWRPHAPTAATRICLNCALRTINAAKVTPESITELQAQAQAELQAAADGLSGLSDDDRHHVVLRSLAAVLKGACGALAGFHVALVTEYHGKVAIAGTGDPEALMAFLREVIEDETGWTTERPC